MASVLWPVSFIATDRDTPACSMFLTAERRKSWIRRPGSPAARRGASHGSAAPRSARSVLGQGLAIQNLSEPLARPARRQHIGGEGQVARLWATMHHPDGRRARRGQQAERRRKQEK